MVDIQSERRQESLIIALAGSLDALTAGQVQDSIKTQFEGGQQQLVLDLSQVDFMSSSGVRLLLELLKTSRTMGGDLRLAAAQPGIERTLDVSGLLRVLKAYPSVEEAVNSFSSEEP
jgi:anti-anti-sigma factor